MTSWVDFFKLILERPQYLSIAVIIVNSFILVFPFIVWGKIKTFFKVFLDFRKRFLHAIIALLLISAIAQLTFHIRDFSESFDQKSYLGQLTPEEKIILKYYIVKRARYQRIRVSGAVMALQKNRVVYNTYNVRLRVPSRVPVTFNIESWAYSYLIDNPKLLE